MGIFSRLLDRNSGSSNSVEQEITSNQIRVNPLCSNYENLFAQIRPLVDEMKAVRPYGVGRNGARLDRARTPELALLDSPNDTMGWVDFIDTCFVIWLTESELNIHVHRDRRGKVLGYSILPVRSREVLTDGQNIFKYQDRGYTKALTDNEVMTLRFSRSPMNIDKGVSPSSSVLIWAQIDDLIAQYQRAFFQNGAVPATLTFIKASTREKYEAKRQELESKLHGARNKNKTIYIWRQFLDDGTTGDEIEVKTIQGSNNTLALSELIGVVNDKLNKSVGVSDFILGDDSSAKYDNAELSDLQFTKRRVYPALLSFWSSFQHELDRIVGGLGYGIQFDLDIPELTDRLRVKSETIQIQSETLVSLINAGASPSSVVNALGLSSKWQTVADGIYSQHLKSFALQAVSRGNYGNYSANTKALESKTEDAEPKCCECSHDIVRTTDEAGDYEPVWTVGDKSAKEFYDVLLELAKQIAEENPEIDVDEALQQLDAIMEELAKRGALDGGAYVEANLVDGEMAQLLRKQIASGVNVSPELKKAMENRVNLVVSNYIGDFKNTVAKILHEANNEGWTRNQLEKELKSQMPKARAELIARCETHNAILTGRLDYDKNVIEPLLGIKLGKQWLAHIDSKTCPVCASMNEKIVSIDESFPDHIMTDDGEVYFDHNGYNDDGQRPNAHPNCRCSYHEVILEK